MTPEQHLDALLQLPKLYTPHVSPDGQWVAWTWYGIGPAADVYVAPTDGSAPPFHLSNSDENTVLVAWTPDSSAVLVQQDKSGNERVQLFRIELDRPTVMEPLTEEDPSFFLRGGQLHPNGRWLIYGANVDPQSGAAIEPTIIYRQNLESGERLPLAHPTRGNYVMPMLNHQGTHVLYNRNERNPSGEQLWLVGIDGQDDREIVNAGDDRKVSGSWFPDGERVVCVAETETHRKLGVWDRASGELRWWLDDPSVNIEDAFVPHSSDKMVLLEAHGAKTHASLLDLQSGVGISLPDLPGSLTPLQPVGHNAWIGVYRSATQPTDIVRFSLDEMHPESFMSLTRVWERTTLRPEDLAPAEDFRWQSVDGMEIQGWLYRAPGQSKGTILHVHGGPTAHDEDAFNAEVQFYVSQGFNVLKPNYRGSTGFSLAYQEAIKQDGWGGREQDDIRTGAEALIAAGIAERGKIGVTGTSYGGYSSWCQITHSPPDIIAAAAPVCGMTDLVVDYETTRPDLRPYSEEMLGGRPDQVPERYRARSPIHFVQNIQGALLIVQGLRDPNVTPQNVSEVARALQDAGVEYQLLTFDDEGHGIRRPHNQRTMYARLAAFFAEAFANNDEAKGEGQEQE
ncbi:MAG TPA: prolyl oligopeptidase family serine peptidase [Roseiflexaceae bacterium]|nr:prolyl oligopeptidase family serine peptidase [Roseiflexaceae bacterium]